ncbi:MAG: hypothetical protein ACTTJE_04930 [Schwartzia sp. (in: firmicutes)]
MNVELQTYKRGMKERAPAAKILRVLRAYGATRNEAKTILMTVRRSIQKRFARRKV